MKLKLITVLAAILMLPTPALANFRTAFKPQVVPDIINQAKQNVDWKRAVVTGENAQLVFISISPQTNPNNELGIETNECDTIIIVLEGNGTAHLNRNTTTVKTNDMLFIPEGTAYNLVNNNPKLPLKLMCFFTETDMAPGSSFKTKASVAGN